MQQVAVRLRTAVGHAILLFNHDLQIADRPEAAAFDPQRWHNDLLWTVLLQFLKQLLPLLVRQFVGIAHCPAAFQRR